MIYLYDGHLLLFLQDKSALYDTEGNRYLTMNNPIAERALFLKLISKNR